MKMLEASELNVNTCIMHGKVTYCNIKIKLGHSPLYLPLWDTSLIDDSPVTEYNPLRHYGGVLADNTGTGKTITTLGLIFTLLRSILKKKEKEKDHCALEIFRNITNREQIA